MSHFNAPAAKFAHGQQESPLPLDAPLNLTLGAYTPTWEGHPPQGTVTDDMIPDGIKRPKLFDSNVEMQNTGALALKNRIVVSPMCQYSARDGLPSAYHLGHHASWALHGVGTIVVEASGVVPEGRITPQDLGIWNDAQAKAHASLVSALRSMTPGLTMGIQLAHAGRKASTWSPFHRGQKAQPHYVTEAEGGWVPTAPSAVAYNSDWLTPRELSTKEMGELHDHFVAAAERAFGAGYDFVELHAAHGYFLHSALSPLSNKRTDAYGGSFEGRTKLLLDITRTIRQRWPERSVWVRVSASDQAEHLHEQGIKTWDIEETKKLATLLDEAGVDVIDCSSGGLTHEQRIKAAPAYQLPFAAALKQLKLKKMLVAAVGILESAGDAGRLAEKALQENEADLILLARGLLANPKWAEEAAENLMGVRCAGNPQYHRVHPAKRPPPIAQNHN